MTTKFYVYSLEKDDSKFIGFGVSSDFKARNKAHRLNFLRYGFKGRIMQVIDCASPETALKFEVLVKNNFQSAKLSLPGFVDESFDYKYLPELEALIADFDFANNSLKFNENYDNVTKGRVSKRLGIPVDELNLGVVYMFTGLKKNHKKVYNHLVKYEQIRDAAFENGISFKGLLKLMKVMGDNKLSTDDVEDLINLTLNSEQSSDLENWEDKE